MGKLKSQKEEKKKLEGVGKNYISPERLKAPGNADCEREREKKREKESTGERDERSLREGRKERWESVQREKTSEEGGERED